MLLSEFRRLSLQRVLPAVTIGRQAAAKTLEALMAATPRDVDVVLDLEGVEACGASFLRDSVVPWWRWLRQQERFIAFCNASVPLRDEIELAASVSGVALVFAEVRGSQATSAEAVGRLDPKVAQTLNMLAALKRADAKALASHANESSVQTVWHNRLAVLHQMGLVTEHKEGRTRYFAPLFEGLHYGN